MQPLEHRSIFITKQCVRNEPKEPEYCGNLNFDQMIQVHDQMMNHIKNDPEYLHFDQTFKAFKKRYFCKNCDLILITKLFCPTRLNGKLRVF